MNDDKAAQAGKSGEDGDVQGEGDYKAARRFDKASLEFVKSHDVEKHARDAAPRSPAEAQSIADAEEEGRRRSRGDDEDGKEIPQSPGG